MNLQVNQEGMRKQADYLWNYLGTRSLQVIKWNFTIILRICNKA